MFPGCCKQCLDSNYTLQNTCIKFMHFFYHSGKGFQVGKQNGFDSDQTTYSVFVYNIKILFIPCTLKSNLAHRSKGQ